MRTKKIQHLDTFHIVSEKVKKGISFKHLNQQEQKTLGPRTRDPGTLAPRNQDMGMWDKGLQNPQTRDIGFQDLGLRT